MHWSDYMIISGVTVLIGVALLFGISIFLRRLTAIFLTGTVLFCVFSLDAFIARTASSRRQQEGRWSEEFRDGIHYAGAASRPYFPYIMISAIGLCLLASFPKAGKDKKQAEQDASQ